VAPPERGGERLARVPEVKDRIPME